MSQDASTPQKEYSHVEKMRHSAAHVLAMSVLDLFPGAKLGIGPIIDNGFYYDFVLPRPIEKADLKKLEQKMREFINRDIPFTKLMKSRDEAIDFLTTEDQPFKVELVQDMPEGTTEVSFYQNDDTFIDLCRGPHVDSTGEISAFKLLSTAGSYWRGDETRDTMTRIYGTAWESQEELDAHLTQLEEAKKRDHKKLGKELDLFVFSEKVGPGLPLWTPRGTLLRNELDNYVWELRRAAGYQKVEIPHITKKDLYETSGHWDKFADELFRTTTREGHEFAMKPMNCPHHTQIFDRKQHSYREMPQRFANTTMCYRDEQTGELNGISRTRAFTQDDAHVFCRPSQIIEEAEKIWDIIEKFYAASGLTDLEPRLSLHDPEHPEKYLGSNEQWLSAEDQLREILQKRHPDAIEQIGEAAFYGPKIDFIAKDAIGRTWQVATIQLDMNMPERFDLTCINEDGDKERIVMIHAAIMGSIERFLSILIEHTAGNFPTWLAPVQVALLPVSDAHNEFAANLAAELESQNIRAYVNTDTESVGKKIRESEKSKVPYMLVIGDKEKDSGEFQIRRHGSRDQQTMSKADFIAHLTDEITSRTATTPTA